MQKSKKSFSQHFGIEVESSLQWQSWEPGREYTEIITLTNVDLRAKKLKYRIVNAKYFTAKYPQVIVLNVGAKVIIPITFRPLEKNMFEDSIEFITKDGSFHIPIMAVPAEIQLSTPETINFGMCAVQDSLTISFEIANICDLYVSFQLQSDTPFILQPVSGNLAPRTQCKIKATFQPEGAFVYETAATCTFGDVNCKKNTKTIMLEGIGKFPHLSLKYENITGSEITVDFGEVNLGETVHKVVDINNLSPVNVPFQVIQKSLGVLLDNAFQCSQYHGIVPAEHTHKIKLSFKPENFDMVYIDYFEILPVTLINKSIIKCIGRGKSANVSLNIKSVNFGVTGVGVEVVRSFKLQNGSCSPAIFQLKTDLSYSMFLLNTACGVIEANSSKKIIVKFTPTKPIPYYKKLFCLVHNQEPLVIELFGTCVSKDIRPAVLTQKHIDNNSIYMLRGISRLSPENISLLMEEKKIVRDENDLLQVVDKEVDSNLTKNRSVSLFDEFFCNGLSDNMYSIVPHVCVDVPSMNFGIAKENFLFHKSVCVSNHTHGKVICVWINAENNHFFVTPAENEIAPMSSMSFKVTFKPDVPNKMYGAELEAFVFYKSMRDYRLVDENTITVPWCLTITATGHTFGSNSEFYLPVCSWSSKTMVLPPVTSLDQPIYRTCVLQNDGYNPIHCAFTHDDTCVFSSKPDICLLKEKFHLFVYRMSPIKTGISRFQARCTLNFSEKYNHDFDLTMTTETVNILFNEGNLLYFMPTCIGHKSHQSVQIQNSSRVPIKLRWKISKYDQQILSVEEEYKTILPNEVQNHLWTFTPVEELKHLFKVKLLAHIDNLHEQTLQKYIVKMVGESQSGAISCEEESVAVGEIIVGSTSRTHIVLNNTGGCSLDLFLSIEEFFINSEEIVPSMDSMFQLDHYELCLPSYSSKMLAVTVSPKRKGSFKAQLFYQLRSKSKHEPKLFLCNITVYAVYPHIFVNDIRGAGCAQYYSKKYLLELFKIDSLNHLLHSDPELEELKYNASSRFSTQMKMPQTTRAVNQFDFGSAVQRSDDCIVRLSLENKGNTSVKWVIKYSTDFQLDIEPWANPGTLKDDELHEMFVLKNKIFSVDPLYGEIPPSKSQIVKFSYQNLIKGVHKLPVLFKIIQGREIMLNLLGTTLDYSVNALHLTSLKHTFTSISISCEIPLAQIYTLYNPTNNKLGFEFDLSILDKLQEENYDCRILECLTPTGEVFPRQTFDTQWVFSPVEAKEYHVDVLLTIQSGNSSIISFFGTGLDDSVSKENKIYKDECLSNQFIASPDELLKISTDVLSFGDIPMFSESSQLVFLTNMSEHYDVYYDWKVKKSFISIFPSQGVIKPRNHIVCKVTIHAQGIPSIHKIDVICEITNKTHMDKFVKERSIWSTRLEEKKHLFTICDIASAKNVLRMRTRPESQNVFSSDTSSKAVPSVPLPPIKRLQDKDQLIFIDGNDGDDPEPLAPKSFPVHLFVCVNIHSIKSFFDNFPELVDTVFIQRNPLNRVKGSFHNSIKNSDEEYSLIDNILALLIRDCLEDRDFECSVDRMKEEPIPYYGMFAQIFNSIELNGLNQSKEEDLMKNHVQYITDKPLEAETEEITPRDLLIKVSGSDTLITDRENLKRNDEVRFILKDILDNTLFNLISEATFGEISLTNRPQLISVPPNLGENSR